MKKIVIYMSRLKYGGMEKSLINFLNMSNIYKNNKITLYLCYCLDSKLLDEIPKNVHIKLLSHNWNVFGKLKTAYKLLFIYVKSFMFRNSYDTSICYTNHQSILSSLARLNSKNSILFVHSDIARYSDLEFKKMKRKIKYEKFKTIVCNSKRSKKSLQLKYSKKLNIKIIPNYVDGKQIIRKSKEKISEKNLIDKFTFINIANHVEQYKNITSIIHVCNKLKEKYSFQLLLIGSGPDTHLYEELIKKYRLEEYVLLLGTKRNPYPYLVKSQCLIFSSKYEGYGMVLDEARVLNIPIISTDCGASKEIVNENNGFIYNTEDELEKAMTTILNNPMKPKTKFDYEKFNDKITYEIMKIL